MIAIYFPEMLVTTHLINGIMASEDCSINLKRRGNVISQSRRRTCKYFRAKWSTESLKVAVSGIKSEIPLAAASRTLR
jgi:hypothetical protein